MLDQLLADATLTASAKAKQGLDEMVILFKFLEAYKIADKVLLFLSPNWTYILNLFDNRSLSTCHWHAGWTTIQV